MSIAAVCNPVYLPGSLRLEGNGGFHDVFQGGGKDAIRCRNEGRKSLSEDGQERPKLRKKDFPAKKSQKHGTPHSAVQGGLQFLERLEQRRKVKRRGSRMPTKMIHTLLGKRKPSKSTEARGVRKERRTATKKNETRPRRGGVKSRISIGTQRNNTRSLEKITVSA